MGTSRNNGYQRPAGFPQPNDTNYWCDDAIDNTEFMRAYHTDFLFPPHMHETYSIGVIEYGGHRFRPSRKSPIIMPSGQLCVINPGVVHEGRAATESGYQYRMFCPTVPLVERLVESQAPASSSGFWAFDSHVIDDPELYEEFRSLHIASCNRESVLERESRAILFLAKLLRRHAGLNQASTVFPREPKVVAKIVQHLHDRFDQPVRISDLAAETNISETHVIRSFSGAIGMPPHSYLVSLRIERARKLLRAGHSLADTAISVGFADQSQLTRHFKRLFGTSPGRYSTQVRQAPM